jgi:hypothetical protein
MQSSQIYFRDAATFRQQVWPTKKEAANWMSLVFLEQYAVTKYRVFAPIYSMANGML